MIRRRLSVLALCLSASVLVATACKKKETPATPSAPVPTATFTATSSPTPVATSTPTTCSTLGGSVSTTDLGLSPNLTVAKPVTFTQSEIVAKIHFKTYSTPIAGTHFMVGIYSNNANYPVTLVASSAPATGVLGWNEVNMGNAALGAGTYWLAISGDQSLDLGAEFGVFDTLYLASGSMPVSFPIGATLTTNNPTLALYLDICP